MKKLLLTAFLVVALCAVAGVSAESNYSFREDYDAIDEAAKSLFYVEVYNKYSECYASASGFVCFDEHLFVTNFHVVDGASFLRVWDDDNNMYLIKKPVAVDEKHDLAILKFPDGKWYKPLELDTETELKRGQPVVTIGSPRGFMGTVAYGNISAFPRAGDFRYIQFTAPTSHGSSGGCLFADSGKVIGITSAGSDEGQNIGLAVPATCLQALYESWKNQPEATDPPENSGTGSSGAIAARTTAAPAVRGLAGLTKDSFRDYFDLDCKVDYKEGKVTFSYSAKPSEGTDAAAADAPESISLGIRLHLYSSLKYSESEIDSFVIAAELAKEQGYCAEGVEEIELPEEYKSIFWDREIESVEITGTAPGSAQNALREEPPADGGETALPEGTPVPEEPAARNRTDLTAENFRDYFDLDCKVDCKEGKVTFTYAAAPSDGAYALAEGATDTITLEIRLYLYSSLKYSESEIDNTLITVTLEKDAGYACEGTEEITLPEAYSSVFWDRKIEGVSGWVMK